MSACIKCVVNLSLNFPRFYRVKKGQTLSEIASVFRVPPCLLAKQNNLTQEVQEGQVLSIPVCGRDRYVVHGGESKTLLCGSKENYESRNGTKCLYPTQVVYL